MKFISHKLFRLTIKVMGYIASFFLGCVFMSASFMYFQGEKRVGDFFINYSKKDEKQILRVHDQIKDQLLTVQINEKNTFDEVVFGDSIAGIRYMMRIVDDHLKSSYSGGGSNVSMSSPGWLDLNSDGFFDVRFFMGHRKNSEIFFNGKWISCYVFDDARQATVKDMNFYFSYPKGKWEVRKDLKKDSPTGKPVNSEATGLEDKQ